MTIALSSQITLHDGYLCRVSLGRAGWKEKSGYHRRSITENMMYRLKQLGDRLFSRAFDRQVAESHVRAAIINQVTYLGIPKGVRPGQIAPTV